MADVQIVEVGPRDGLQNEKKNLILDQRLNFINHLAASGLKRIEVGAFVSPQWVPQMAGSAELINRIYKQRKSYPKGVRFSALVPNPRGMLDAQATQIEDIALFGAASESFSRKNINCTIAESLVRFQEVMQMNKPKRKVRGYLSMSFGCPYEGAVPEKKVVDLIAKYLDMGMFEVSIGDTIGVANPKQVRSLLKKLKARGIPIKKLAMHFHDTRGTALANVLAALDMGVSVFDSSFGGLGGCPYAPGASGNLATDDLVYMLEAMGVKTGVDLGKLISFNAAMAEQIGRALPARTAQAGLWIPKPLNSTSSLRQPTG